MVIECQRCGNDVTRRFARVFGDNDGEVHGCLDCLTNQEVQDGMAAGLERRKVPTRAGGASA